MTRLWLAAGLALSGSLLLHGGGMLAMPGAPAPQTLAGGAETVPPLTGDSFADLAQGMAQPVAPVAAPAPVPPAASPVVPASPPLPPATTLPPAPPVPAEVAVAPVAPDGPLPVAPRATRPVAAVSPVVAPAAAAPVQRPAPRPEALAALARPARTAPEAPKPPAIKPGPEQPVAKAARPRMASAQGGEKAARKGTSAGSETGQGAKAQGKPVAKGDGGQAEKATYGALVMRKIANTRKRTTGQHGTVIVAFSIAQNGQLGSVTVARSSGAADLDAMGVDHVRRAAPFPAPPHGIDARFSVAFKGR